MATCREQRATVSKTHAARSPHPGGPHANSGVASYGAPLTGWRDSARATKQAELQLQARSAPFLRSSCLRRLFSGSSAQTFQPPTGLCDMSSENTLSATQQSPSGRICSHAATSAGSESHWDPFRATGGLAAANGDNGLQPGARPREVGDVLLNCARTTGIQDYQKFCGRDRNSWQWQQVAIAKWRLAASSAPW